MFLRHLAILLLTAAFVTLPGLGRFSLWDIDEGLNAEAAREMLESGDWIVPTFNFKPRTAKPALIYWLQASSYSLFGVSEFAARLPSALAVTLTSLLIYDLGRRMFGPATGLLAGVALLSCIQVCVLAHAATPDAILLFTLTLTFWLFWIGYVRQGRAWLVTCGLGCGLALLAKGPVGLVMPAAIIIYFLLARRELHRLWDGRLALGLLLMFCVAGPWYIMVTALTHGAFLKSFLTHDNVNRFTSAMEGHRGPIAYYLVALLIGLAPWCVVLGATIWDSLRSARLMNRSGSEGEDESAPVAFLVSWAAVYLAFFSAAQTKLPNYILPVYPPMILLSARTLIRWSRGDVEPPRWLTNLSVVGLGIVGLVAGIACVIGGGAVSPSLVKTRAIEGLANSAWIGAIPLLGAGVVGWCVRAGRRQDALTYGAIAAVAFVAVTAVAPIGAIDAIKAPRPLAELAGANQPTEEIRIAAWEYFQPSLVFYVQREVGQLEGEAQAIDFLRGPLPSYLVCPAAAWERLAGKVPVGVVLGQHRDFYRGFDVVIVSNRPANLAAVADRRVSPR